MCKRFLFYFFFPQWSKTLFLFFVAFKILHNCLFCPFAFKSEVIRFPKVQWSRALSSWEVASPHPWQEELSHIIQLLLYCCSKGTAFSEGKRSRKIHTQYVPLLILLRCFFFFFFLQLNTVTIFFFDLVLRICKHFHKNLFLSYLLGVHLKYA